MNTESGWDLRHLHVTKKQRELLQPLADQLESEGGHGQGMILLQYVYLSEESGHFNAVYLPKKEAKELRELTKKQINRAQQMERERTAA